MAAEEVRSTGMASPGAEQHVSIAARKAQAGSVAQKCLLATALCAAAVAGRVAFASIASVQPVTAVCIVAGVLLGRRYGLSVGVMTALASNMVLGQGVWTIWQMVGWGLAGWLAGVLASRGWLGRPDAPQARAGLGMSRSLRIYMYGFVVSLLFGFIMNTWTVAVFGGAMQWQAIVGVYAAGLPFDLAHAASTVAFLVPMCAVWRWKSRSNENSAEMK